MFFSSKTFFFFFLSEVKPVREAAFVINFLILLLEPAVMQLWDTQNVLQNAFKSLFCIHWLSFKWKVSQPVQPWNKGSIDNTPKFSLVIFFTPHRALTSCFVYAVCADCESVGGGMQICAELDRQLTLQSNEKGNYKVFGFMEEVCSRCSGGFFVFFKEMYILGLSYH